MDLPETLVAVCLDANCMGEGRLRLSAVEELAGLIDTQELSVEVWIPEPVVWEWAEHIYDQFFESKKQYVLGWQVLEHGGFESPTDIWKQGPADVDEVVRRLTHALEATYGLRVLFLESELSIARLALRDQILQLGVARRKSSVKSGAADSASFRLIDSKLSSIPGNASVAVVSGDQDARTYFTERRDVVLLPSLWAAKRAIVGMRTGSEIAEDQVEDAIRTTLPEFSREQLQDAPIDGRPEVRADSRLRGREVSTSFAVQEIERVLSIDSVDVSFSDGYGTALVDVEVVVARELQVLSSINDELEYDVDTFDGVSAVLQVSAMRGLGNYWSIEVDEILFS